MVTWFGNQKTVTKLMMGFAFTGAIMAGLVGVGLNTAGVMRDNIENVNNVQLKPLMEITELRGLVHQVRSWVIQAVLTRDSADRQQALTKIEEIKTKTDELRRTSNSRSYPPR
ncbi:MAG: hypothetical protein E8D48_13325 [Nitrospira sp.]|nr:MAG: hypothetical protein E8D48_13325 [Nitrospira sp.]